MATTFNFNNSVGQPTNPGLLNSVDQPYVNLVSSTGLPVSSGGSPVVVPSMLRGVNFVGNDRSIGPIGPNTQWPTDAGMQWYLDHGATFARLVFLWQNLIAGIFYDANGGNVPTTITVLDETRLQGMDHVVNYWTSRGAYINLDMHQGGRFWFNDHADHDALIIGESVGAPTSAQFANVWAQIASRYVGNPFVKFGLDNEPHNQNTTTLIARVNLTIAAIRATGCTQDIVVDPNGYADIVNWNSTGNDSAGLVSNAQMMLALVDPIGKVVCDGHRYFDNAGGTSSTCVVDSGVVSVYSTWIAWSRANGNFPLYLGEFGAAPNTTCYNELLSTLDILEANNDVVKMYTAWGAFAGQVPYTDPDLFFYNTDPTAFDGSGTPSALWTNVYGQYIGTTRVPFAYNSLGASLLSLTLGKDFSITGGNLTGADETGNGVTLTALSGATQPTLNVISGATDGVTMTSAQYLGSSIANGTAAANEILVTIFSLPSIGADIEVVQGNDGSGREARFQQAFGAIILHDGGQADLGPNTSDVATPVVAGQKTMLQIRGAAVSNNCYITTNARPENAAAQCFGTRTPPFSGSAPMRLGPGPMNYYAAARVANTIPRYLLNRMAGKMAWDEGMANSLSLDGNPFTFTPPTMAP